jgi:hypothetical protein
MCGHWGSIGLGVSSTFGTIISSINTSQTFTITKSGGISLPPTLLLGSPQITTIVTFCQLIRYVVELDLIPT